MKQHPAGRCSGPAILRSETYLGVFIHKHSLKEMAVIKAVRDSSDEYRQGLVLFKAKG